MNRNNMRGRLLKNYKNLFGSNKNHPSVYMSSSFKKSYKLGGFIGVLDVVLCHLKNMAHSNVIINTVAKEFLFLQERRKLRIYGNITWGIGVLLL
jgi:hypothetical protein